MEELKMMLRFMVLLKNIIQSLMILGNIYGLMLGVEVMAVLHLWIQMMKTPFISACKTEGHVVEILIQENP